uniref:Isoform 9 of Advanced glycosylation end product-specific receptor n=1 Tax=Mus musculus TaxID=10090 RepID=Q62151-9|nr:receptor for advanced glycation end-products splice variant 9 [Mus musculus]
MPAGTAARAWVLVLALWGAVAGGQNIPALCCSSLRWGTRMRAPIAAWPPTLATDLRKALLSASGSQKPAMRGQLKALWVSLGWVR